MTASTKLFCLLWRALFFGLVNCEFIFPHMPWLVDPTTTPKPWQRGEIIQTKPVDTYPWVTRACPSNLCDPAPVFKIIEATPTGTGYGLLDVLYPSDTAQYKLFLESTERKRLCNGTKNVLTKCSFFQEFVIYAGGTQPLQILGIHDPGYDDIYLRMRFATLEDTDLEAERNKEGETEDLDAILLYCGIGITVVLVLMLICLLIKRRITLRRQEYNKQSDRSQSLQDNAARVRWNKAMEQTKSTIAKPINSRNEIPMNEIAPAGGNKATVANDTNNGRISTV